MGYYGSWDPYVPVAVRRAKALVKMDKLREKGLDVQPIEIQGRIIAKTFWGKAWTNHLESLGDYENRLPRGRTYVRNGSVCHLAITKGKVVAKVIGSKLYNITIRIKTLESQRWKELKEQCAGQVGSLLELLQGRLSEEVLEIITDKESGMFPLAEHINLSCSCPDWATMCKHVSAALYGVGARLDEKPELLFLLRGVNQEELIDTDIEIAAATKGVRSGRRRIADDKLSDVFSINIHDQSVTLAEEVNIPKKQKTKKAPVPQKTSAKIAARSVKKTRPVTAKSVARLRKKFGMSQAALAVLLNVSTGTIGNWEKKQGPLKLSLRSKEAMDAIRDLTKQEAEKQLRRS